MREKIRVLVVDDQYIARSFFESRVETAKRYELVASLANAEQAISFCQEHSVDLVIMDIVMKYGLDGLTCAQIILTTSTAEDQWLDKARKAGIESFWFKEYSDIPLTEVMDRTMAGESVYPGSSPNPSFGNVEKTDLTERELDVLRELTLNLTNDEIAKRLNISTHTVKIHIEHLLDKTGYRNRIDLAVNARLLGLVVHEGKPNSSTDNVQETK